MRRTATWEANARARNREIGSNSSGPSSMPVGKGMLRTVDPIAVASQKHGRPSRISGLKCKVENLGRCHVREAGGNSCFDLEKGIDEKGRSRTRIIQR